MVDGAERASARETDVEILEAMASVKYNFKFRIMSVAPEKFFFTISSVSIAWERPRSSPFPGRNAPAPARPPALLPRLPQNAGTRPRPRFRFARTPTARAAGRQRRPVTGVRRAADCPAAEYSQAEMSMVIYQVRRGWSAIN